MDRWVGAPPSKPNIRHEQNRRAPGRDFLIGLGLALAIPSLFYGGFLLSYLGLPIMPLLSAIFPGAWLTAVALLGAGVLGTLSLVFLSMGFMGSWER